MKWEKVLLIKFSNDVEKYEIEVSKIGQNNPLFLTVWQDCWLFWDVASYYLPWWYKYSPTDAKLVQSDLSFAPNQKEASFVGE